MFFMDTITRIIYPRKDLLDLRGKSVYSVRLVPEMKGRDTEAAEAEGQEDTGLSDIHQISVY